MDFRLTLLLAMVLPVYIQVGSAWQDVPLSKTMTFGYCDRKMMFKNVNGDVYFSTVVEVRYQDPTKPDQALTLMFKVPSIESQCVSQGCFLSFAGPATVKAVDATDYFVPMSGNAAFRITVPIQPHVNGEAYGVTVEPSVILLTATVEPFVLLFTTAVVEPVL